MLACQWRKHPMSVHGSFVLPGQYSRTSFSGACAPGIPCRSAIMAPWQGPEESMESLLQCFFPCYRLSVSTWPRRGSTSSLGIM